jgi:hypothetical protein
VTELGIVIEVRPVHPTNDAVSMATTVVGMVTDKRSLHSKNALDPILVTAYVVPPYVTDEGIVKAPEGIV